MTAAELIAILQKLPGDLPVVVQGYETGWDDIHTVEVTHIERYRHAQPWDGEYKDQGEQPAVAIVGRREQHRQLQR